MARAGDVVIIGGGIIGCLSAWFLRKLGHAGAVTVIEKDPSYRFASTALSAASIRAQFACPVNVELSLYGAQFLRNVRNELGEAAEIGFVEGGYLILGEANTAQARSDAFAMQRALGADVVQLGEAELAQRFPWLHSDDVAIATFGQSGEGWFDAWALLQAARSAAGRAGVQFLTAEARGFETRNNRIVSALLADRAPIAGDWFINAAGPASGKVARWLDIALPVAPKKRTVFHFKAPLSNVGAPMLFDTSGAWMRPEGEGFIGGIQPDAGDDPDADGDFEPQHDLFEMRLWPLLAARVPVLEQVRLLRAWAGHYEMNTFDHNGVVGAHHQIDNFVFATGFSGHGVMHAPGVARAVAELITTNAYRSIDAAPLGFDRIVAGKPMPESSIY